MDNHAKPKARVEKTRPNQLTQQFRREILTNLVTIWIEDLQTRGCFQIFLEAETNSKRKQRSEYSHHHPFEAPPTTWTLVVLASPVHSSQLRNQTRLCHNQIGNKEG
jgi:hypothetical protein